MKPIYLPSQALIRAPFSCPLLPSAFPPNDGSEFLGKYAVQGCDLRPSHGWCSNAGKCPSRSAWRCASSPRFLHVGHCSCGGRLGRRGPRKAASGYFDTDTGRGLCKPQPAWSSSTRGILSLGSDGRLVSWLRKWVSNKEVNGDGKCLAFERPPVSS